MGSCFARARNRALRRVSRDVSLLVVLFVALHTSGVAAQAAPTAPPPAYPAQAYPAQAYPPQQAYPQQPQAYPAQAYPQQQAYPQTYPPPPVTVAPQPYPPPVYAQPVYTPPPAVYVTKPQRAPRPPRPKKGMLIGGVVTLGVSYAIGLVSGAILVDTACCEEIGWDLFIPVAGPFMAANHAENGRGALMMFGIIQVVGAGLTLGGIIQYAVSSQRIHEMSVVQRQPFGLARLELREGRSLTFDVATNAKLAGPTLKYRF